MFELGKTYYVLVKGSDECVKKVKLLDKVFDENNLEWILTMNDIKKYHEYEVHNSALSALKSFMTDLKNEIRYTENRINKFNEKLKEKREKLEKLKGMIESIKE